MSWLCRLGLHVWSRLLTPWHGTTFMSTTYRCRRCGRTKKVVLG